ncbi:MAG: SMI1/KNR4 family protein [Actinomycetia bacterium]|nr:SMI1/KNR4 family protein [Actinomycetes bacterium]MCP4962813.1 SMI1/KNR4 family protein [Actinomycetes bacterium]
MVEWRQFLPSAGVEGLHHEEIAEIAGDQGGALPEEYVAFLAVAGRRCGLVYHGSRHFYPDLLGIREDAKEILSDCKSDVVLRDGQIVFGMHQGYHFFFFEDLSADPAVFGYREYDALPTRVSDSFSQFLADVLREDWGGPRQ